MVTNLERETMALLCLEHFSLLTKTKTKKIQNKKKKNEWERKKKDEA